MTDLPSPSTHALLAFHARAAEESRWTIDEAETGGVVDLALVYQRVLLKAAGTPHCSGVCITVGTSARTRVSTFDCMIETTPPNHRAYSVFKPVDQTPEGMAKLHHDAIVLLLGALDRPPPSSLQLPPSMSSSIHHVLLRPAHRSEVIARVSWDMGRPPHTPTYIRF